MCDKCDELDKKIEQYRSIGMQITDEKTIEGLKGLIEACLAQRAALHPDQKAQGPHQSSRALIGVRSRTASGSPVPPKKSEGALIKPGTKIRAEELVCETVARRYETAHVADSQRSSDPLFKNKRSRTIAKGDGLGLRLVLQRKAVELGGGACSVLRSRRISSCETPLTLTPHIAVRSFERLAKDYGCYSKKIVRYPRASECKLSDSGNWRTRRNVSGVRRAPSCARSYHLHCEPAACLGDSCKSARNQVVIDATVTPIP
jgi:hypothetical protein